MITDNENRAIAINSSYSMIVRVSVVLRRTVVGSSQNYPHPDDHTIRTTDTPGFKPFTIAINVFNNDFFYFLGYAVSSGHFLSQNSLGKFSSVTAGCITVLQLIISFKFEHFSIVFLQNLLEVHQEATIYKEK